MQFSFRCGRSSNGLIVRSDLGVPSKVVQCAHFGHRFLDECNVLLADINETSADSAQILRVCGRIRELASSFLGQMEAETALDAVADKLLALNRPALAAAVLTQIGKDERALEILMDHDAWDEAKSLALRLQQPQYTRMLESRYKDFLRAQGKVEQVKVI